MNSNSWHKEMYDEFFAAMTIGSKAWTARSKKEADFILKLLELPIGSKILDLPCGTGRHSVLFAKQGYKVLGLDISRACLSIARKHAAHNNVSYKQGNMAKLEKFKGQFDAVTNLFTSFGYFKNDQENKQVLKGMVRCLKPGGKIVIQTINRDFLLPQYKPAIWKEDGDIVSVQASKYDPKTKYNESYISIIDRRRGLGTSKYHRVRLYSPNEITTLLKDCGCTNVQVWGDFEGSPLSRKKSSHPIYLGIKP